MEASRRDFLRTATGALSGLSLAGPITQASGGALQGIRERKDVSQLGANSPDIQALTTAVRRMKTELGPGDRRNWAAQAAIHGTFTGGFTSCQHGNWFFLPWHRGYLYYFEEIVRALSGNDAFALPYWDWSKDFSLPAQFWGANNPLDNPPRPAQPGSGRQITPTSQISPRDQARFVSASVIFTILNQPDFETFAGLRVEVPGQMAGAGELEQTPHNFIHRWIGGDMGTGGSPYDPIFWLHHCNVDRLWTEWVRKHPDGLPDDPGWLGTTFRDFCDRNGNPTTIDVRRTLLTTNLGYRYAPPGSHVGPVRTGDGSSGCDVTVAEADGDDDPPAKVPGEVSGGPEFVNGVAVYHIDPPEHQVRALTRFAEDGPGARNTVFRMRLQGVKIPRDQNVLLQIHVNCRHASRDLSILDPSYVRSLTFFYPHGQAGHGGGGGHDTVSFLVHVNPVLGRLYADRPFTSNEPLKVVILAEPLFPDTPRTWRGEVQEVSPENISFEVVNAR